MSHTELIKEKNSFAFYWKITHFSLCSLLEEIPLKSPIFRIEELDNTEWNLLLYPDLHSQVVLNIYRQNSDNGPEKISVDVKLFLLKTDGDKVTDEIENFPVGKKGFLITPLKQKRSAILEKKNLFCPDDTLTVGCFIKKHSDNLSEPVKCTAYTDISTEKISFAFPFKISEQQLIKTISKTLKVSKKYPIFKIVLKPICSENNSEFMAAEIEIDNWSTKVICKCKLSVVDEKNQTVFLFEGCNKYLANGGNQSWNLNNSVEAVENKTNRSKDSSFLLRCVLNISDGTFSTRITDYIYPVSTFQIKQQNSTNIPAEHFLKEKLKCLLADSRLCDFTLQVDGQEFRIHKAVLGALSPVFCAMFELEMKEKENSVSIMKDINASTMQKLINFAYTENVENLDWESAMKLYSAADIYQIPELKNYCARYLTTNLTVENLTDVLTVSDRYQDSDLEKAAGDFVFAHAEEVFRSEKWNTCIESKMTVAIKIMQKTCLQLTSNPELKF